MQKHKICKWVTAGLLALSAVFFFLPYRAGNTPLEMFRLANQFGMSDLVVEGILQWVVPVAFTLLAALMMVLKVGTVKCVMATIFCIIATILHIASINIGSGDLGAGIILNLIVALLGIVLPVVTIVLTKIAAKEAKATIIEA